MFNSRAMRHWRHDINIYHLYFYVISIGSESPNRCEPFLFTASEDALLHVNCFRLDACLLCFIQLLLLLSFSSHSIIGGKNFHSRFFLSLRKPHASSASSSLCLLHYSMAMMLSFSRSMSCSLLLIYELRRILMGSNFIFYQRDNENNERKINTVIFQSTLGTMSTMTFAPATNIWEFMDLLTNKRNV